MGQVKVTRRKLEDYRPDPHNANQSSPRGQQAIEQSFAQNGAGRSLLADADGTLIAGNQALKGARAAGIDEVIEVETDGRAVVVVKRTDLRLDDEADDRARKLAYADNRAGELSLTWNAEQVAQDIENGVDLSDLFRADELDDLLADLEVAQLVNDKVDGDSGSSARLTGDRQKQIKPVLYVDEVALFEQALRATGINNRGQAVLEVCRFYLEHLHDD
jgi:hypothetical protein